MNPASVEHTKKVNEKEKFSSSNRLRSQKKFCNMINS